MARGDKFLKALDEIDVIESSSLPGRVNDRFPSGVKRQIAQAIKKIPLVIFTSDIDELLKTPKTSSGPLDLTGAGFVALEIVPAGKRWTVLSLMGAPSTGACKLRAAIGGVGVDISAALTTQKWSGHYIPQPFTMLETDQIGAIGASNGADGAINHEIIYVEEDMF